MKRTVAIMSAVAALGVLVSAGTNLHALPQNLQQGGAPAAARPKLGAVNLVQVIRNYDKWKEFEKVFKTTSDQYNAEFERKKAKMVELTNDGKKLPPDDPRTEPIKTQLKDLERQMQDLGEAAKKQLGKLEEEQAVQIYKEVEEAVVAYARANDLEMVVQYSDAVVPAELYHPMNVLRKMRSQACIPVYMAPNIDITNVITAMLNQRVRSMAPQGTIQQTGGQR